MFLMSYSLFGRFIDVKNKKILAEGYIDFMKNVSDMRYSARFDGVEPDFKIKTEDFSDLFELYESQFVMYSSKEILDDEVFVKNSHRWRFTEKGKVVEKYKNIILDEDFYEENKDHMTEFNVKLDLKSMFDNDAKKDDIITISVKKRESVSGTWYTYDSFTELLKQLTLELKEKRESVDALNKIRLSAEYYNMSEEGRSNFISDLEYEKEDLDDLQYKVDSVNKLLNIFEFFSSDMCFEGEDSDGIRVLNTSYEDGREVELFVEVY